MIWLALLAAAHADTFSEWVLLGSDPSSRYVAWRLVTRVDEAVDCKYAGMASRPDAEVTLTLADLGDGGGPAKTEDFVVYPAKYELADCATPAASARALADAKARFAGVGIAMQETPLGPMALPATFAWNGGAWRLDTTEIPVDRLGGPPPEGYPYDEKSIAWALTAPDGTTRTAIEWATSAESAGWLDSLTPYAVLPGADALVVLFLEEGVSNRGNSYRAVARRIPADPQRWPVTVAWSPAWAPYAVDKAELLDVSATQAAVKLWVTTDQGVDCGYAGMEPKLGVTLGIVELASGTATWNIVYEPVSDANDCTKPGQSEIALAKAKAAFAAAGLDPARKPAVSAAPPASLPAGMVAKAAWTVGDRVLVFGLASNHRGEKHWIFVTSDAR